MNAQVLLVTPPFTQLNTPYPATAYLKGFLNTKNISSVQADLGIEVTIAIFSTQGLIDIFQHIGSEVAHYSANAQRIITLRSQYIQTIAPVISFLQGHNPTLAHRICQRRFLPEASRFAQLDDMVQSFGSMGTQDKAKHLATMYLEDLSDLIKECVDEHFGFTRYAERLGRSALSFDDLYTALQQPYSYVDTVLITHLKDIMERVQPTLLALSIPFPGNLYAALRCGQWVKQHYPHTKVVLGGGYANTELRSVTDIRVFKCTDFITLDDGEAPIENLLRYLQGVIPVAELKRTFVCEGDNIVFYNNPACTDYKQGQIGTPDYTGLPLDTYISAIEVVNPMHSMWSDGRWNKLTMAHGCYWGKCTFCDISLDYIKRYEPLTAAILCDRMEEIIQQTGQNGFHFVDEAAPPALMRELALEILRRRLVVSWWTNIRFEKSFTRDLCLLLKASGCIAVSGGLEVASDRLLALIQKGITVAQVAMVNKHFTEAGIMVHAYLMYGFPTQTAQETIDSMEMVRQMFQAGILQSAYWHQFAMTEHSPVGMYPDKFSVRRPAVNAGSFANNDVPHEDPNGTDHDAFTDGLKKSLFNYMHAHCLDYPLQKWFEHKVPKTTVAPQHIVQLLEQEPVHTPRPDARVIWLGAMPSMQIVTKSKKGATWEQAEITFHGTTQEYTIKVTLEQGKWLMDLLPQLSVNQLVKTTLQQVRDSYEAAGLEDFELFWDNKPVNTLYQYGLLVL